VKVLVSPLSAVVTSVSAEYVDGTVKLVDQVAVLLALTGLTASVADRPTGLKNVASSEAVLVVGELVAPEGATPPFVESDKATYVLLGVDPELIAPSIVTETVEPAGITEPRVSVSNSPLVPTVVGELTAVTASVVVVPLVVTRTA
jgi:hypothetical protein